MIHKNCILRILYNRRKANQLKPDNHGSLVICSQRWLGGVDWRLMAVAIGCVYCWSGSIQSASVSATTDFLPLSLDLSMPGWTNSISRPNNHNPDTRLPSSSWTSLTRAHTLAFLCFRKRFSSTGSLKLFKIDQKITQFFLNCLFFFRCLLADQIFRFNFVLVMAAHLCTTFFGLLPASLISISSCLRRCGFNFSETHHRKKKARRPEWTEST